MKLSKITFNNFRVFEKDTFDFKPLTVLTGSNSSGKSTIVKALILLQENLKPSNYLGRLTFKDGFHNLGNFQSILTKESSGKTITFDIEWENINHKKNHKKRDLFEGIQFINVVREYEQDSIQEQNGILKRFELNINENENIIRCYKNDDKFEIEINHAWFIDKILENGLFKFNPQLYKIWDKIKVEEINIALEEWRGRFDIDENRALNNIDTKLEDNEEYVQLKESLSKLEIEDDANTKKNTEIRNKVRVLRTEIRAIEKDYTQRIGEIQKKINELDKKSEDEKGDEEQEQRTNYYSQIDILESNKDEGVSNIESQIENIKLGYEVSDEDRELFEEQQRIENQLQDIKDQEKINLENEYERLRENIRESKLRTFLYEQLKVASESFLINLREIELNPTVPNLGVNTIADYLVNNQWGNKIYELTENEESKLVEELISWNEETSFIESVILEDRRSEKDKKEDDEKGIYQYEGIKFHQIIGQGDNNQLAKLLIEKISELINQFTRKLPFIHLSAMRGFQQRVYKTSQPKYHLEDALSKLLGMQHKNSKDKLNFINEWVYYFGISDDKKNKLIAEIIEGDYVRGFIESGSKKEKINIADFGLGISQLLPIIIYTADAIDTDLLICIEEPGTHLHPTLQAKLVEFMLSVNRNYNLQFLIETHSETFIRKLQYEIVNNEENKPDSIVIRYLNYSNGSRVSQRIGIDENGELVDVESKETIDSFGDGFLDEGTKWINKRLYEKNKETYDEEYIYSIMEHESKTVEFKETMFVPVYSISDKKFFGIDYPKKIKLSEEKSDLKIKEAAEIKKDEIQRRLKSKDAKKSVIHSVIKNLAAFANSDGGHLIIGIGEDINHKPYISDGVDLDIDSFEDNTDGFLKAFDEALSSYISQSFRCHKLYWINITKSTRKVLLIEVFESKTPIYCKNNENNSDVMYIRREASTVELKASEIHSYIKNRFSL
jgi:predicted ATP-dependent endonuclease of OLD family